MKTTTESLKAAIRGDFCTSQNWLSVPGLIAAYGCEVLTALREMVLDGELRPVFAAVWSWEMEEFSCSREDSLAFGVETELGGVLQRAFRVERVR